MEALSGSLKALRSPDTDAAETAARRLKKIAEADPATLHGLEKALLREALRAEDLRVRWNLIVVLGKLPLLGRDRDAAVDWMWERLRDGSPFTRTFAMQALMDLSEADEALRRRVLPVVREFAENGTAAMRARARKLLAKTQ